MALGCKGSTDPPYSIVICSIRADGRGGGESKRKTGCADGVHAVFGAFVYEGIYIYSMA